MRQLIIVVFLAAIPLAAGQEVDDRFAHEIALIGGGSVLDTCPVDSPRRTCVDLAAPEADAQTIVDLTVLPFEAEGSTSLFPWKRGGDGLLTRVIQLRDPLPPGFYVTLHPTATGTRVEVLSTY